MGEVADPIGRFLVDAGVNETQQEPVFTDHSHGAVTSAQDFPREIGYPLEEGIDV